MVPNEDGRFEPKECHIFSWGMSEAFHTTLSLERDLITVGCPTKPMTGCETSIEFDAGELEDMFKVEDKFWANCPGCRRQLALIKSKGRTFYFGWVG
jgi:hypothetical protein